MPIYEYLCTSCGYEFEEVQKFSDPSLEECPDCRKNSAERQVSVSSFHLKGGGWYKDGYSSNSIETEKTEKSLKEKSSSTAKENSTKDKPPGSEKSTTSEKKESTSTKTAKTLSKERAA